MKKILLFITLLGAFTVLCASEKAHITPPGFEKSGASPVKKEQVSKAFRFATYNNAKPQKFEMTEKLNQTKGIRLINSKVVAIDKNDNNTTTSEYSYSYDQYGFMSRMQNQNLDEYTTYDYKWYTPGWKWSEKKETWYYRTDSYVYNNYSKENRTFHNNGSVASKIKVSYDGSNPECVELEEYYDENGHLIKSVRGTNIIEYTYFALLDIWLTSEQSEYSKESIKVEDDSFSRTEYMNENGDWVITSFRQYWFDKDTKQQNGSFEMYYSGGVVTSSYGNRTVKTQEGNQILVSELTYDQDIKDWREVDRWGYSLNFNTPWVYKEGETRWRGSYDINTNKIEYDYQYSWINTNVVKEVYTEGDESYTEYIYITPGMTSIYDGYEIYYEEKTGNYATSDYEYVDNKDIYIYTYFDSKGNIVYKLRNSGLAWEQWNGSAWVKCTSDITVYDSSDRLELKFDSNGRLVSVTEYENGKFEQREDYVYTANGYEITTWEMYYEKEQLYKSALEIYSVIGDIASEIFYEYRTDGSIYYASRNDFDQKQKIHIIYSYNSDNNSWSEGYKYAEALVEILPDGKRQTIERELDENGVVFNSRKTIELYADVLGNKYDYHYYEYYFWDKEKSKWIGEYKNEQWRIEIPDFDYKEPTDPLYIADYFVPADLNEYVGVQEFYNRIDYVWDIDNDDWTLLEKIEYSAEVTDNCMILTSVNCNSNYNTKETHIRYVDDARRLIKYEYKLNSNTDILEYETNTYDYDEAGRLTRSEEDRSYSNRVSTYTYGEISYFDSVSNLASDNILYKLSGKVLENNGASPMEVFNVQGSIIAVVEAGNNYTFVCGGVYVVRTAGNSTKLYVK